MRPISRAAVLVRQLLRQPQAQQKLVPARQQWPKQRHLQLHQAGAALAVLAIAELLLESYCAVKKIPSDGLIGVVANGHHHLGAFVAGGFA